MAELCRCGHPLDAHTGTGVSGVPCRTCATAWRTSRCDGWSPAPPMAGPTPDEATRNVDPAEVQSMPVLCKCGHDRVRHGRHDICDLTDTCRCFGWWPPGSVGVQVDEHGNEVALSYGCTCPSGDTHDPANAGCRYGQVAAVRPVAGSPADLDQAIHAATQALREAAETGGWRLAFPHEVARVAVEAAAPILLQTADDALADAWIGMVEELQATRDRLATLAEQTRSYIHHVGYHQPGDACTGKLMDALRNADAALGVAAAQENPQ